MAYRGSPKGGSFRRPVLRGEELVQQAIVDALRLALPDCLVFSIPNQTAGNAIQGMKMKLTGQVGGIPDLCVIGIGHTGDTVTMFLEVKTEKGRLSDNQREMHPKLQALGCPTYVVRTADNAYKYASFHYPVREITWAQ